MHTFRKSSPQNTEKIRESHISGAIADRPGQEVEGIPVAETMSKPTRRANTKLKRNLPPSWLRVLGIAALSPIQSTFLSTIAQAVK
jgi:hypothetical protein